MSKAMNRSFFPAMSEADGADGDRIELIKLGLPGFSSAEVYRAITLLEIDLAAPIDEIVERLHGIEEPLLLTSPILPEDDVSMPVKVAPPGDKVVTGEHSEPVPDEAAAPTELPDYFDFV